MSAFSVNQMSELMAVPWQEWSLRKVVQKRPHVFWRVLSPSEVSGVLTNSTIRLYGRAGCRSASKIAHHQLTQLALSTNNLSSASALLRIGR